VNRVALSLICLASVANGAWAQDRAPMPTLRPAQAAPGAAPNEAAPSRTPAKKVPVAEAFAAWLTGFKARAAAAGISAGTLATAFRKVRYNAKVVAFDNYQPEFVKPIGAFIENRAKPAAVAKGRRLAARYKTLLAKVEAAYGVPREYVLAIWRVETGYGSQFGGFNVIEALATLAFHGRRKGFWADELLAALRILDHGDVRAGALRGSWAGAMGHTQFMPSTYLKRAVDFDGDGRRDIWKSLADAFGSTANYLKSAGWQPGMPFGIEVRLPKGFDYSRAHTGVAEPVATWRKAGVTQADGKPLPAFPGTTSIIVPAGYKGPVFLVTANYRALLHYNNAAAYALTVGILAERLAGRGRVVRPWPNKDRPLRREEKEELQRRLIALGYDPGPVDGKVGPSTRAAIRAFQQKVGNPADGYANFALLKLVRSKSSKKSSTGNE
jgi:membrane-bound lytic murein transglycosylase B